MEAQTIIPDRLVKLELSPAFRNGRARVRRELAEDLRSEGWLAASAEQERIAASIERGER